MKANRKQSAVCKCHTPVKIWCHHFANSHNSKTDCNCNFSIFCIFPLCLQCKHKVSEVCLKFPKFATNLGISLHSCQSNCELKNKVLNFTCNEVGKWQIRKLRSSQVKKFELLLVRSPVYFPVRRYLSGISNFHSSAVNTTSIVIQG